MIHETPPENFKSKHETVSCFCEYDGKVLFLLRVPEIPEGNKWGPPAGRVEVGEDILDAVRRELFEETGMDIPAQEFQYLHKYFIRYPDYDFIYHVFKIILQEKPALKIDPAEHTDHQWLDLKKPSNTPFVLGQDIINKKFY